MFRGLLRDDRRESESGGGLKNGARLAVPFPSSCSDNNCIYAKVELDKAVPTIIRLMLTLSRGRKEFYGVFANS